MGLWEWMGESLDPGSFGSVELGGRNRQRTPWWVVLVCFGLAVLLLGLWIYLVLGYWRFRDPLSLIFITLGTIAYLFLGYFCHPNPDTSNMGWMGGLFDNPFRFSDDMNRFWIFLILILYPGRFIAESMVDMVFFLSGPTPPKPKKKKRKRQNDINPG